MKSFLVLGLGRFGRSLSRSLYELGHDVLAVDDNEEIVQSISDQVTQSIIGDCTDENVLKSLGVGNFDAAIVAIGEDMQSSIMVTVMLKELGAKKILAKAQNEIHAKVLQKVGADKVVFPERDMGVRVAQMLTVKNFLDYIELSPDYSIMEISAPDHWTGKTLKELDIRGKYGISVMTIKSDDGEINIAPKSDTVLKHDDVLIVIGENESLNKI